jgi:hypothetical protein
MTEYLIQRDGFSRLVEYFGAAARSRDRRANFGRAFGQSLDQFEGEVLEYLHGLVNEVDSGDLEPFATSSGRSSPR